MNYFHKNGRGLSHTLACGLGVYLNSTLVDLFFRLFNGHTQVNATDLRKLKYPTLEQLLSLGNGIKKKDLESLFRSIKIPLVMVTTFLSRKAMIKYLPEIAWETDVWVAEDATHLIHFNGEHLLQAYEIEKKTTS
ncbi:MAG: BsuBI/PstI family type II restriction endonuclease [Nostoc sp. DedQUE12a]|nr:BsuBI/PstI family type II restriction endonuclease [Nostoc sp. DedQUE12a]